ncbi:MAG: rRNA maturation RNase YbeY [Spirochaetaceae bacterium]|jgi:probable rRNA maturation factor|nr:rRNA maturation RNase YbeY [Spirochaetaceae bacterium]
MKNRIAVTHLLPSTPGLSGAAVRKFIAGVLYHQGITGWEVSVLFCDDPFIAGLNSRYRGVEGPTDVLSFALGETYTGDDGVCWYNAGDIVISLDTLASHAAEFAVSRDEELKRLLVHGVLHLAGHDHGGAVLGEGAEEASMLKIQETLLQLFSDYHIISPG